jgi:predicted enzyme related to lactoylglutathione lyase
VKHTVCHIEFGSSDLDRTAAFYCGLFNWTVERAACGELLFRSPDGLQGTIRQHETVTPNRLPLIRVELNDLAPILDLAVRFHGGYAGFVDPLSGDWAMHLRDPDGNLIRLARAAVAGPPETVAPDPEKPDLPPASNAAPPLDSGVTAVVKDVRRVSARPSGHANGNGNGNGNGVRTTASKVRRDA